MSTKLIFLLIIKESLFFHFVETQVRFFVLLYNLYHDDNHLRNESTLSLLTRETEQASEKYYFIANTGNGSDLTVKVFNLSPRMPCSAAKRESASKKKLLAENLFGCFRVSSSKSRWEYVSMIFAELIVCAKRL